jgi:hypothetical protein
MNDQADIPHDPNGPGRHNDSLGIATERIEVIVSAAERAAAGIIADAEAQARRYLDESREQTDRALAERTRALAGVTESLVGEVEEIKRRLDDLIRALQGAAQDAGDGGPPSPEANPGTPPVPPSAVQPQRPEPLHFPRLKPVETEAPPPQPPGLGEPAPARPSFARRPGQGTTAGGSSAARLLATQMAVAGSSRSEIEIRLRNEFGIDDAGPMLDVILGPEH